MNFAEAVALGALQGVTEFLPISSDGHLALADMVFQLGDLSLPVVVLLHSGTLLATLLAFRADLVALTRSMVAGLTRSPRTWMTSDEGRIITGAVAASLPTALIGLLLEERVEHLNNSPLAVGLGLLGSAAAVWSTRRGGGSLPAPTLLRALAIGVTQGCAVLPGLSRSGTTIACGMLLGMSGPAAFRFSFLISLPAVAGAVLLKLGAPEARARVEPAGLLGAAVAFLVGYCALCVLRGVVGRGKFWGFAAYLVPLGLAVIAWDLWR